MTKEQFLEQLNDGLIKLPKEEREDILQDFLEHFSIGLSEGKNEREIISSLGSPRKIAREMTATYYVNQVETDDGRSAENMAKATYAVIGLGFFNLVIVLGPLLAIFGLIVGGWGMSLGFTVSPVLVLTIGLIYPGAFELYGLFASLLLCGLGLFIGIGMYYATKGTISLFMRYLRYNINLVKGGLN